MYRAHRRFIGPPWAFLYPSYFVKLHYRPLLEVVLSALKTMIVPAQQLKGTN
jgi:hypothetical protein